MRITSSREKSVAICVHPVSYNSRDEAVVVTCRADSDCAENPSKSFILEDAICDI